jgi:hypothetical protein
MAARIGRFWLVATVILTVACFVTACGKSSTEKEPATEKSAAKAKTVAPAKEAQKAAEPATAPAPEEEAIPAATPIADPAEKPTAKPAQDLTEQPEAGDKNATEGAHAAEEDPAVEAKPEVAPTAPEVVPAKQPGAEQDPAVAAKPAIAPDTEPEAAPTDKAVEAVDDQPAAKPVAEEKPAEAAAEPVAAEKPATPATVPVVEEKPAEPTATNTAEENPTEPAEEKPAPTPKKSAPSIIKLERYSGGKSAVTFPHRDHTQNYSCQKCHHKGSGTACFDCHKKTSGEAPSFKDAMHKSCKNCHKNEGGGPTKCAECHT